jgi:membrane-bound ClpP family serine protease
MIKMFGPSWVPRAILALISLVIVMFGAATLFNGKIDYYNLWGGIVFAPIAIIIGSLGLIIAALKPKILVRNHRSEKAAFEAGQKDECVGDRFFTV